MPNYFIKGLFLFLYLIINNTTIITAQGWKSWNGPQGGTVYHQFRDSKGMDMLATQSGVWKRNQGETNWSSASVTGLDVDAVYRLAQTKDGTYWAATNKGIYQSLNASAWAPANYNLDPQEVRHMEFNDDLNAIQIGTSESGFWYIQSNKQVWARFRDLPDNIKNITAQDGSTEIYLASSDTNIIINITTDVGGYRTIQLPFQKDTFVTSFYWGETGFWATTNAGSIIKFSLRSPDEKIEFVRNVTPARGKALTSMTIAPGNRMIVTDEDGVFYESSDEGVTWKTAYGLPTQDKVHCVAYEDTKEIRWGVSNFGFAVLDLAANSWRTDADYLPATTVQAVTWAGNQNVIAGMFNTGIGLTLDQGQNWRSANRGLSNYQIQALYGFGTDTILCGLTGGGVVVRSIAGGLDWQITGEEIKSLGSQCFARDKNDRLYVGTVTDGVYFSDDRGSAWIRMDTLGLLSKNIQSIAIQNGTIVWAGTRGAGVRKYVPNQSAWTGVTDGMEGLQITALVWNPVHQNLICANNDGIYQLNTLGNRWELRYRLPFGSLVTAMVVNKKGYIIASTNRSGIFISQDDAKSWKEWSDGLPSRRVRSLAINANDYLLAGMDGQGIFGTDIFVGRNDPKTDDISHLWTLYPNPSEDMVTLSTTLTDVWDIDYLDYHIFDMTGRRLLTGRSLPQSFNGGKLVLNVANLSAGVYRLQIVSPKGLANINLMKR